MVDKPGCYSNPTYLADFVEVVLAPRAIDLLVIREMYVEKGLTAAQISEEIGASKQMVLSRLRRAGVRRTPDSGRAARNYRYPEPPFGFRVRGGKLTKCASELRIVRLILRLRSYEKLGWTDIVNHLNADSIRTRHGRLWSRAGVKRVYARWEGKI